MPKFALTKKSKNTLITIVSVIAFSISILVIVELTNFETKNDVKMALASEKTTEEPFDFFRQEQLESKTIPTQQTTSQITVKDTTPTQPVATPPATVSTGAEDLYFIFPTVLTILAIYFFYQTTTSKSKFATKKTSRKRKI